MRAGARLACACACALLVLAAAAAADVRVYRGRHRPVEELLPIVRALLGDAGRAEADVRTNSLVLVGDARTLAEVEAVLAAQDRAPRTVLLRYGTQRLSDLEAAGVRVRWSVEGDGYRVGNAHRGEGTRIAAAVAAEQAQGASALDGSLRVIEGGAGILFTGASVPMALATRDGPAAAWVSAESGFEARPRILGDGRVHLELRPFDARLAGPGVEHAGAATTLVIAPGEQVVIGGLATQHAGSERGSSGAAGGRGSDERVLVIRVEIE
jgi:type II secretory pathway component GspD/PulD (secretin)